MFANRLKKYGGTGGTGGNPGGDDLFIELDGISQHLITEKSVAHNDIANWSISMWFYTVPQADQADSAARKFLWCDVVNPNSGTEEWGIGIDVSPGFSSYFLRRFNSWLEFSLTRGELVYNDWNHVVISKSGNTVAIYVNSGYEGAINDGNLQLSDYSCFGGDVGGLAGSCMTGYVNDIRLFSRNLVQADVNELYTSLNQDIAVYPELDQCFLDEGPVDGVATGTGSIIDTSVASNNLTPVDGPIYRLPPFAGVLEFDGITQYMHTSGLVGNTATNSPWAVSMWLYREAVDGAAGEYRYLWQNRADMASGDETGGVGYGITLNSLYIRRNNGWVENTNARGLMKSGEWIHLVFSFNGISSLTFYINSVFRGNIVDTLIRPSDYSVFAGTPFSNPTTNGMCHTGRVDDVRIFDRALGQGDVDALYANRNQPITTPPEYLQAFLDEGPAGSPAVGAGSIIDTSVAGNNLTPVDGPIYRAT